MLRPMVAPVSSQKSKAQVEDTKSIEEKKKKKTEPEPTPPPEPKKVDPHADVQVLPKTNGTALFEQKQRTKKVETEVKAKTTPELEYSQALKTQTRDDQTLAAKLTPEKNKEIDERVSSAQKNLGTPWGDTKAVTEAKKQLDEAGSDPERLAILQRQYRGALPVDGDAKNLTSRQGFVQNLAAEANRDPKLRAMSERVLLDEANLRSQKPGVRGLMEQPPKVSQDPNAATDLQNAQVFATSAFTRTSPEEDRALLSSRTPQENERLGKLLTTPVEVPSQDPNNPSSSRRQTLERTLTSLTEGKPNESTKAFVRSVAENVRSSDLTGTLDAGDPSDDRSRIRRELGEAWGHQQSPDDPAKASLHSKVLQHALLPDGEFSRKLSQLPTGDKKAVINGVLDDPANYAFAHPGELGLASDQDLRRAFADETTSRWKELSPEQQQQASKDLQATMETRQGRDLLLSHRIPAELRAGYLDTFRHDPAARTDLNGALAKKNLDLLNASGRTQPQTYSRSALENSIGTSLGLSPDPTTGPNAANQVLRGEDRSFFTQGRSGDVVQHLSERIRQEAGTDTPEVRIIPVQFASATSGSSNTAVFGVKDKSGKEVYFDHEGRKFNSFEEWKKDEQLPSGTVSYPDQFNTGEDAKMVTTDTPRTGRDEAWSAADLSVLTFGVASQAVQKIPTPATVAIGTAGTFATVGYGALRGGMGLSDQASQGRSLNPIRNPETIPDYLNIATSALPITQLGLKQLASAPQVLESPGLTKAVTNLSTGTKGLEVATGVGQIGNAWATAAQNPNDPGALLNAALTTAFYAPHTFKTAQELKTALTSRKTTGLVPSQTNPLQGGAKMAPLEEVQLPEPIRLGGQSYQVASVSPEGNVVLLRNVPPEVYRNGQQLVGSSVRYQGGDWTVSSATPKELRLTTIGGAEEIVPTSTLLKPTDGVPPSFQFAGEGYHLDQVSPVGGFRFVPDEPLSRGAIITDVRELGSFQASLRGRESDGIFEIGTDPESQMLRARKLGTNNWGPIEPTDVLPSYTKIPHSDFGEVSVPTAMVGQDNQEILNRPQDLGGNWARARTPNSPVITDPTIGSVPQSTEVAIVPNAQAGQILTESVRTGRGPLILKMKAMEEGGAPGKLVDALVERRNQLLPSGERTPVTIVMNPVEPIPPEYQQRLDAAGVKTVYPKLKGDGTLVVHQKSAISPDRALLSTGEVDPDPNKRKFEVVSELTGTPARQLYNYEQLVATQKDPARRAELIESLSKQGVLLNDPQAGKNTLSRGIHALIGSAREDLTIMASHKLSSPEATQQLISAARRGVKVRVVTQGVDPQSRALLQQALQDDPTLPLKIDIVDKKKFVHTHANIYIADGGRQSITSTAFLWPNQLRGTIPDGSSFENGLSFTGGRSKQLSDEVEQLLQTFTPVQVDSIYGGVQSPTVPRRQLPAAP